MHLLKELAVSAPVDVWASSPSLGWVLMNCLRIQPALYLLQPQSCSVHDVLSSKQASSHHTWHCNSSEELYLLLHRWSAGSSGCGLIMEMTSLGSMPAQAPSSPVSPALASAPIGASLMTVSSQGLDTTSTTSQMAGSRTQLIWSPATMLSAKVSCRSLLCICYCSAAPL